MVRIGSHRPPRHGPLEHRSVRRHSKTRIGLPVVSDGVNRGPAGALAIASMGPFSPAVAGTCTTAAENFCNSITHSLFDGVELGILERRHPHQPAAEGGRQSLLGNINPIAQDEFQGFRQWTWSRCLHPAPRGWSQPRCRCVFIFGRSTHTDHSTLGLGETDYLFNFTAGDPADRGQEFPLVRIGCKSLVHENAMARIPRAFL